MSACLHSIPVAAGLSSTQHTPQAIIQACPKGMAEGKLLGGSSWSAAALLHDWLHQLDEDIAEPILPPIIHSLCTRQRSL